MENFHQLSEKNLFTDKNIEPIHEDDMAHAGIPEIIAGDSTENTKSVPETEHIHNSINLKRYFSILLFK